MILSLLLSILLMPGVAPADGGAVAGTLRGTDGKPAARVRVGVMALPERGRGVSGAGTLVSQVETDDAGKFQLEGVPPGWYYIVAGRLQTPTFYPGVSDRGAAKTIQVVAKATVSDINFQVLAASSTPAVATPPSVAAVKVLGHIILKNANAPMPSNITLQASPIGQPVPPRAVVPATTVTLPVASDGTFKADIYAADQYLSVVGLPTGYSVVSMISGGTDLLSQPITIKSGVELTVSLNVGDIRPRYRLMALVREDSSERPLQGERIEFVPPSGEVRQLVVNAQGMVTVPNLLPGTYVLRLASAEFDVPEKQVVITNSSVEVELRPRKK